MAGRTAGGVLAAERDTPHRRIRGRLEIRRQFGLGGSDCERVIARSALARPHALPTEVVVRNSCGVNGSGAGIARVALQEVLRHAARKV